MFWFFQVCKYVKQLLKLGTKPSDIGVIAPYRRQVRLLRERLKKLCCAENNEVKRQLFKIQKFFLKSDCFKWFYSFHSYNNKSYKREIIRSWYCKLLKKIISLCLNIIKLERKFLDVFSARNSSRLHRRVPRSGATRHDNFHRPIVSQGRWKRHTGTT